MKFQGASLLGLALLALFGGPGSAQDGAVDDAMLWEAMNAEGEEWDDCSQDGMRGDDGECTMSLLQRSAFLHRSPRLALATEGAGSDLPAPPATAAERPMPEKGKVRPSFLPPSLVQWAADGDGESPLSLFQTESAALHAGDVNGSRHEGGRPATPTSSATSSSMATAPATPKPSAAPPPKVEHAGLAVEPASAASGDASAAEPAAAAATAAAQTVRHERHWWRGVGRKVAVVLLTLWAFGAVAALWSSMLVPESPPPASQSTEAGPPSALPGEASAARPPLCLERWRRLGADAAAVGHGGDETAAVGPHDSVVLGMPACSPEEVQRLLPAAGGYDCAISKPMSSKKALRLEAEVLGPASGPALSAPLTQRPCVHFVASAAAPASPAAPGESAAVVARAAGGVDFVVALLGAPEVQLHVRGEDVALLDMEAGAFSQKRPFTAAPEHWQDFVLFHRAAPMDVDRCMGSGGLFQADGLPLEFKESALLVGSCVTLVGEVLRDATGALSLQPYQASGGGERWRASRERVGAEPSATVSAPWNGRVLVSDDPMMLCAAAETPPTPAAARSYR